MKMTEIPTIKTTKIAAPTTVGSESIRKMNDLEDKVSSKEEAQKRKEADRLAEERALQDAKKAKAEQSKDFLDNIQAFSIE
jgi:CRISPR/Cas system CSM-associated protein Csm2 small subunit